MAVTWVPPQYAKQQVLKFRLGTYDVTTLRRPCLNPLCWWETRPSSHVMRERMK